MKKIHFIFLLFLCCSITKSYGQATALADGNIVTSNIGPSIINSSPAVSNPIASFSLMQTVGNANVTQVKFTTAGTYTTTDITTFTLYVNAGVNSISGATLVPSGTLTATGAGLQTMNLSTPYTLSTSSGVPYYFFVVPTFASAPVSGHTISVASIPAANIAVSTGSVTGSAVATGTVTIVNPVITGAVAGSRCGTGTVSLSATASTGSTINWFDALTAGTNVGTGTSFTTPSISGTTTYYAEASQSATIQTGSLSDNTVVTAAYQMDQRSDLHWFSSTNAVTINSVDVYPNTTGNLIIVMKDNAGTLLATAPIVTITAGQISNTVPVTIPLGFSVPAGATNYQIGGDASFDGTEAWIYRGVGTTYGPYPATVAGFSLTGDAAVGVITGGGQRAYFYNWKISLNAAATPRTADVATVTPLPTPTFTTSPGSNICVNSSVTYTTQSGQSSYVWTVPGASGTDYNITAGGIGSSSNTVTLTWLTTGGKTVTVNYSSGSCPGATAASSATTVNPLPVATFTASPGAATCSGVSTVYTTQAGQNAYTWTVPGVSGTDYTITAGGTGSASNTATLTWLTSGGKTVTVNYTNTGGCTGASAATTTTTVNLSPVPAFTASASANTCRNSSVTYTAQPGQSSYIWGVPGTSGTDYTVTAGGTGSASNTVTLTWLTTGGKTVTINYTTGSCAGVVPATNTTTVNNIPVPTFTVAPTPNTCVGSSVTYTTTAARLAYNWTVPGISGTDYTITAGDISSTSNTVTLTWLTTGSKTVMVNYSNTAGCTGASPASNTTTVNALAVPTFTAAPGASICANSSATYTTQAGQSSYNWVVPGAAGTDYTITSGGIGSASNTVTLTWLTGGSKTVTINYTNAGGCPGAVAASAATTVNLLPTPTFISSAAPATCAASATVYQTQAGQSSYVWSVPGVAGTDYNITAGDIGSTSNSATIVWLTPGSKTVAVNYTNANSCTGASAATNTTTVDALPVPTFISSPGANICANYGLTYSTLSGQSAYTWTVDGTAGTDYNITAGSTSTNTITITWITTGGKNVTVNYTDAAGCTGATPATNTTTVNATPVPTFTSSPSASTCANSSVIYTTQASQLSYAWTVGGVAGVDYTITSGGISATDNTVTLMWLTAGSKTVTVNYGVAAGCTGIVPASSTTTVNAQPVPSFSEAPTTDICATGSATYTTQAGEASYTWSVPGVAGTDYIITSGGIGAASNTVSLNWLTPGSTMVTVNYIDVNGCTGATAASNTVMINPLPAVITGPGEVCEASDIILSDGTSGGSWSGSNSSVIVDATSGDVSGIAAGTAAITYSLSTGCTMSTVVTVNPLPAAISGSNVVCLGSQVALFGAGGGTWLSSDGTIATVGTSSGIVSGVLAGSATITYTLPTGCLTTTAFTVNPLPSGIVGITNVCTGAITNLSDPDGGGSWTSGNTLSATVDAGSGAVTGISEGSVMITYTLPTSCKTATNVTVNLTPAAITGLGNVCVGSSVALSDINSGGSWATSDASIGSLTANTVNGVSQGTLTITYTLPAGCFAVKPVTVNPLPSAIAGSTAVCVGFTTSLTNPDGTSTWSSSNTSIATVNPTSGSVGGVAAGTINITFTLPTGCATDVAFTVNPSPLPILGANAVCLNDSTLLTDLTPGGAWTSAAGTGTVNIDATGKITGLVPGNAIITYSKFGCTTTRNIFVNSLPAPVTGIAQLCATTTAALADAVTGGTWSSSNTALATVNAANGVVSGLSAGAATITYKLPTGCYLTTIETINPLPVVYTVTGGGNYCAGAGGLHVGLSGSQPGVNYQLFYGVTLVGAPMPGTGTSLDFGPQTLAEVYTIVANNGATSCTSNMAGNAPVIMNALPVVYNVTGGGHRCSTGPGIYIGLDGSGTGINYNIYNTGSPVGSPVPGITGPLDLGVETAAGTYTVIATNAVTTCSVNMTSSATVIIDPMVLPTVSIGTGVGDVVCGGTIVHITAATVNGGVTPAYSWTLNGVPVLISGSSYSYLPSDGDVVNVVLTSSAPCASPVTVGSSLSLSVLPYGTPSAHIVAVPGDNVCQGTLVHYSSTSAFGGSLPELSWEVNGAVMGSGASFSYTPANHDNISLVVGSDYFCRTADSGTSNIISMEVDAATDPVVVLTTTPGTTISHGQTVTITTSVTNGGPTPFYQWYVSGAAVPGAVSATFTSSALADGDSVYCIVTRSGVCSGLTGSAGVKIHITRVGVPQVVAAGSDIKLVPNPNSGVFTVKGTLAIAGDQEAELVVTDMLGQVVYNAHVMTVNGKIDQLITLDGNLANGMYLLNVRSGNENAIFHFVIGK